MVDRVQNAVFHCLHLMRDKCKDFFRLSKLFWAKYEKSRAFGSKILTGETFPRDLEIFFALLHKKTCLMKRKTRIFAPASPDGGMVDTHVSGTCAARCAGSSPVRGTESLHRIL